MRGNLVSPSGLCADNEDLPSIDLHVREKHRGDASPQPAEFADHGAAMIPAAHKEDVQRKNGMQQRQAKARASVKAAKGMTAHQYLNAAIAKESREGQHQQYGVMKKKIMQTHLEKSYHLQSW